MGITAVNTFVIMFIVFLCPLTCCLVVIGIQISILAATDLADSSLGTGSRTTGMQTGITTFKTHVIFPFVHFLCHNNRMAAVVDRLVCVSRLDPGDNACVIIGIENSVSLVAFCTDSLIYTGGRTTGTCF